MGFLFTSIFTKVLWESCIFWEEIFSFKIQIKYPALFSMFPSDSKTPYKYHCTKQFLLSSFRDWLYSKRLSIAFTSLQKRRFIYPMISIKNE